MRIPSRLAPTLSGFILAGSLAACAPLADEAAPAVKCPPTRGWTAFINAMPGPGAVPTLIVTGEVEVPQGQAASLLAGPTDRMMPPGQRFALSLVPGGGTGGWREVRAEIKPALPAYREVLIACDGNEIGRISPVEVAQ